MAPDAAGTSTHSIGSQAIVFGVFGKHPGWDDHIRDAQKQTYGLMLDTLALRQIFDFLYNGAIHRNLEVWRTRLTDPQRLSGFDHLVVWRPDAANVVVLRMWPSRDASGRAEFPMAVAAHCRGLALPLVMEHVPGVLGEAMKQCIAAKTAAEVAGVVESTRAGLNALVQNLAGVAPAPRGTAAKELIGQPPFAEDRSLLGSVVVRFDVAMSRRTAAGGKSESVVEHFRLPVTSAGPARSVVQWFELLSPRAMTNAEFFAAVPTGQRWVDVVVGRPTVESLVCLRATEDYLPLLTDVRYTPESSAESKANTYLESVLVGELPPENSRKVAPIAPQPSRKLIVAIGAGAAVVLVIILVLAIALLSGGEPSDTQAPEKEKEKETSSAAAPKSSATPASGSRSSEPLPEASAAWLEYCNLYTSWLSPLIAQAEELDPKARAELSRDPQLAALLQFLDKDVEKLDPRKIAGQMGASIQGLTKNPPSSVRSEAGLTRTRAALEAIRAMELSVESANWPALRNAQSAADGFESRGWTAAAAGLRQSTAIRIRDVEGFFPAAQRLLQLLPVLEVVEARWREVEARGSVLAKTQDKTLASYVALAQRHAAPHGDLVEVERALTTMLTAAAPVEQWVSKYWGDAKLFDAAAFTKSEAQRAGMADVKGPELLAAWRARVAEYEIVTNDARQPQRWSTDLALAQDQINVLKTLPKSESDAAEAVRRLSDAEKAIAAALAISPVRMNEQALATTARGADEAVRVALQFARKSVGSRMGDPAKWLAEVRATNSISRSAALDGIWVRTRDAVLAGQTADTLKSDAALVVMLQDKIKAVRDALEALDSDEMFPVPAQTPGPAEWNAAVAGIVQKQREAQLTTAAGALPGLAKGAPNAGDSAFAVVRDKASSDYRQWIEFLQVTLREAASLNAALDEARDLREAPDAQGSLEVRFVKLEATPAFKDVAPVLTSLTTRLKALRQINAWADHAQAGALPAADLAQLKTLAQGTGSLVVQRVAWLALDRLTQPRWPASLSDLEAERTMLANLAAATRAQTRLSEARQKELKSEREAVGAARWEKAFLLAGNREQLEAVHRSMADFSVTAQTVKSPQTQHRLRLLALVRQLNESTRSDDAKAREAISRFQQETPSSARESGSGKALAARLEELVSSNRAGGGESLASVGPGEAGWTMKVTEPGRVVVYTHAASGAAVEFIRLPAGANLKKSVFLSSVEVPLKVYLAAATAEGNAAKDWTVTWDMQQGYDPRRGPRVWDRDDSGALKVADGWLNDGSSASGGATDRPTADHPMQWISPAGAESVAKALKCRLPTVEEWQAAVASDGAKTQAGVLNLRDMNFKTQFDLAVSRAREFGARPNPLFPGAGIFRLGGDRRGAPAERDNEPTVETNDGTLWFLPVESVASGQSPQRGRFHHLIGNVAEYVTSSSETTASAPELFVIGASALSPKVIDPGTPYAVARQGSVGFSDVGFRLAFDAPQEPLATAALRALDAPELWGFTAPAKSEK